MDQEQKQSIIDTITELLDDPTCDVQWERGIIRSANYSTGWMEARPTDGVTITITVNGGATETEERL